MGANDRQLGKTPHDVIERRGAHAVHADIGSEARLRTIHNAGVKQQDHAVFLGTLVDRPIKVIVVAVQR